MGMAVAGRRSGSISEINMTPMIDVLLVLLIIFMVVQAGMQRGLIVQVPPPDDLALPDASPESLVLEVGPGGEYRLNRQPVAAAGLEQVLADVFAERQRKVLFVKGAESIAYGDVIGALDASRAAGVQVIGLVPMDGGGATAVQ